MHSDQEILADIKQIARECGRICYDLRMDPAAMSVSIKNDGSLVAIDPVIEDIIKKRLVTKFGGKFIGEESGTTEAEFNHELEWIVDPIDGTTNFIRGTAEGGYPDLSTWGICIGLKRDGQPYVGVIYKPQTDELFYAVSGNGAFVETTKFGKEYKMQLSLPPIFSDNRTISGFGVIHRTTMTDKHLDLYSAFGDVVRDHVKSVTSRSHGASGIELTSVASSTYAAYFGIAAEHDIAAARVILQEAGAKISTFPAPEGSRSGYFYMVASHGQIHEQLVKAFKKVIYPNPEISGDLTADAKQIQQQL